MSSLLQTKRSDFGASLENIPLKRQKLSSSNRDDTNDDQTCSMHDFNPDKNSNLKGRRRFKADVNDLKQAADAGFSRHDLKLSNAREGDDEGSVEIVIEKMSGERVLALHLLVSDTSEYPTSHSLFGYSPDGDLPAKIQRIVDELADQEAKPLGSVVDDIMGGCARAISASNKKVPVRHVVTDDEEEGHSEADDYDAFEDYDDISAPKIEPSSIMSRLQQEFVDIVATDSYRPGYIQLNANDFVLSVSLPVIKLAESIPPRALMAWDRRLLSSSQHLTLLITGFHGLYPVVNPDASYTADATRISVDLKFKVGLCRKYKPSAEHVQDVVRKHGLILEDAEDELRKQQEAQKQKDFWNFDDENEGMDPQEGAEEEEEKASEDRFDRFSLSSSLEPLMDQSFLKLVALRRAHNLGWAGAELLLQETEKLQLRETDILAMQSEAIQQADKEEIELGRTNPLPHDPLIGLGKDEPFNLALTAFCYLIRRLSLCTRFCIVCHNKLHTEFEALKPYVCDNKLCAYQYYSLNRGPSLEYEIIHNPLTVDLLVSLAFTAANEGVMDEPLPVGLGLRVPLPSSAAVNLVSTPPMSYMVSPTQPAPPPVAPAELEPGSDGLVDFDDLTLPQMRAAIVALLNTLPSVDEMKKHLERKVKAGKSKPKLKDLKPGVSPAAWSLLRWCVASCTAHIEAIDSGPELIGNLDTNWRQFRLTVGAPDAESKFRQAVSESQEKSKNARQYPALYAFHGSPVRNWHSIIRHGLWFKTVAHGRAYGNGVYLAKDASTSMGYNQSPRAQWNKSILSLISCMALVEVVNLPGEFVSNNPHYVVQHTHWLMCRYLLVKATDNSYGQFSNYIPASLPSSDSSASNAPPERKIPLVKLDPQHRTSVNTKVIEIPDPQFQVDSILEARKDDYMHEEPDAEDMAVFQYSPPKASNPAPSKTVDPNMMDLDDEDDYRVPSTSHRTAGGGGSSLHGKAPGKAAVVQRPKDDWKHDAEWVNRIAQYIMFLPMESSPSASMAIQRELKAMLQEQEQAPCLRDLGWYMPPDFIGDNLYQWIVEMHSFDPALPLAKDMKKENVNSIIFEIRFPPTFPNSPPFFRILSPRFLPFFQGGGGHVTGGGSICMDLLTADGWLPSYSISAVLMQIQLALSNLEPKPARLAQNWNSSYGIQEALEGYKRAAATHSWKVGENLAP